MNAYLPALARVGVLLCIALALRLPSTVHGESSPAELWEFRGRVAMERLKEIRTQLEPLKGDDPAYRDLLCESILETAYSFHRLFKEGVHKTEGGKEYFHLVLFENNDEGVFDLAYIYTPNDTVDGVRIDRLPKGWTLSTSSKALGAMGVQSKSYACWLWFNLSNPFQAIAISGP